MANFTPQEIEQFLQEFFDTVGARQYVGARYIPIFGRAGSDTVEWDDLAPYEPLTVVMHDGVSYVSRRYVPAGIEITDTAYWVETYRFNAQVEHYRQQVLAMQDDVDNRIPFPDPDFYPRYGELGQVLSTLTDGTVKWQDPVVPSDEQAEEVITAWLDDHPEATTTVQDNSLTTAKFRDNTILDSFLSDDKEAIKGRVARDAIWQQLMVDAINIGFIDLSDVTFTDGEYIYETGNIVQNSNLSYSDYVEIPEGFRYLYTPRFILANQTRYDNSRMLFLYDANQNLIQTSYQTAYGDLYEYNLPNAAKYFRMNASSNSGTRMVFGRKAEPLRYVKFTPSASENFDTYRTTGFYLNAYQNPTAPIYENGILLVYQSLQNAYTVQVYYATNGESFTRFGGASTWSEWKSNNSRSSLLYDKTVTISAGAQNNSGCYLHKDHEYYIEVDYNQTDTANPVNLYTQGDNANYKRIYPYTNSVHYTPGTNGYLMAFEPNSATAPASIHLRIYDVATMRAYADHEETFIVSATDNRLDYTSLTQCMLDLKDNIAPKTIKVMAGTYDIYQEYVDANVPVYTGSDPTMDYWDYCVFVPTNTHLLGIGTVTLDWSPDPATDPITWQQCQCVSPLNVAGSCVIANLTITCKNGRYCIHDDTFGYVRYSNAVKVYRNVRTVKYANDTDGTNEYGKIHSIGFGNDARQQMIYENCEHVNYAGGWAFYGHTRMVMRDGPTRGEYDNGYIRLDNCVLISQDSTWGPVKLGNTSGGSYKIDVRFNGCYFDGRINLVTEGSTPPIAANKFDCVLMGCNNVTFSIQDTDNIYPPRIYNTIGA